MNPTYIFALWLAMQQAPNTTYMILPKECAYVGNDPIASNAELSQECKDALKRQERVQQQTLEPMDVPAVKGKPHLIKPLESEAKYVQGFDDECRSFGGETTKDHQCSFIAWTCADKARVLMTSEDGKKHCIKFPK